MDRCRSDIYLATEVRFRDNGLDSVEVQDNGEGIPPESYESVGADQKLLGLCEIKGS